jgi:CHC2 zinc finger
MKPSILEIVSEHVLLRRSGKEHIGPCPFHDDTHPSLSVNEEKGLFHCFGCGESGDVIRFVELIEQTDFKGALKILGIETGRPKPKPTRDNRKRRAAALFAAWINEQHLKIGVLCRELSRQIALAERIPDPELVESLTHEWEILSDLHEDLQDPAYAEELFRTKDSIELITQWAQQEPPPAFPKLTPAYLAYLAAAVKGELC